jgi:methylenetetrahydrofolate--tRNA-(uracil-5-)-methyltransferase
MAAAQAKDQTLAAPPATTAHGALINHITGGHIITTDNKTQTFQPMNINFGLMPPPQMPERVNGKRLSYADKQVARKKAYTSRAMADFKSWLSVSI